ncbi:hypothetical protein G7007_20810 [Pseudomonas entomophila]|uniref:hypothetical protein n=1 Tax=Pseudomonas entomophila TaxID=312306 RepID=UPI0015E3F9E4|nr:hypothetical protein [Pseudomonas entomophila]MBA1195268.1 hypothetical protein [Pseudomonas entomophila]
MNYSTLRKVELSVAQQNCRPGYYRDAAHALLLHVRELQGFISDLVEHLDRPGPCPEKTAEYYQVAAQARALVRQFDIPKHGIIYDMP